MSDDPAIVSHVANANYRDHWEETFGKEKDRLLTLPEACNSEAGLRPSKKQDEQAVKP